MNWSETDFAKEWQKKYQLKYRSENKEKAALEHKKWVDRYHNKNPTNRGSSLTIKEIRKATAMQSGKWKYKGVDLALEFGRSYNAISKIRQKYK